MPKSLLIADTITHAGYMGNWLKLDGNEWDLAVYGQEINHFYKSAMLVFPMKGVTADHAAWVTAVLEPRVTGEITSATQQWTLGERTNPGIPRDDGFSMDPSATIY